MSAAVSAPSACARSVRVAAVLLDLSFMSFDDQIRTLVPERRVVLADRIQGRASIEWVRKTHCFVTRLAASIPHPVGLPRRQQPCRMPA